VDRPLDGVCRSAAAGASRLERLEATREVLLFQAEASLFAGDPDGAALAAERGLTSPAESVFPPPHGGAGGTGSWPSRAGASASPARARACSGSSPRCAATCWREAVPRPRPCAARRARARRASADNDPNLHLYLFLYADALPEESGDDDKVTVLAQALKDCRSARAASMRPPSARRFSREPLEPDHHGGGSGAAARLTLRSKKNDVPPMPQTARVVRPERAASRWGTLALALVAPDRAFTGSRAERIPKAGACLLAFLLVVLAPGSASASS